MSASVKRIVRWLILALVLGLAANFARLHYHEFAEVRLTDPIWIGLTVIAVLGGLAFNGFYNFFFFRLFHVKLQYSEAFALSVLNSFGNLVAPFRGGTIGNAVYLKNAHGLTYSYYVGSLGATYVISFGLNGFLGLVLSFLLPGFTETPNPDLIRALFSIFALGCAAVWFFAPSLAERPQSKFNLFIRIINDCGQLRRDSSLAYKIVWITLANAACQGLLTWSLMHALGESIGILQALFIGVVATFSILVAITPGNLGIREGFAALAAQSAGTSMANTVIASLIERCLIFTLSAILGGLLWTRVIRLKSGTVGA